MQKNVGGIDRVVRIVLAVVLGYIVLAKVAIGVLAVVFSIAAVILALTGIIGWCGLYAAFGISTNKCCCCGCEEEMPEKTDTKTVDK